MAPKKRKTKEAEQAKSPAVSTDVTRSRSSEAASARRATLSPSQGASGSCGKSVGYQRHEIPARKKAKRAEKANEEDDAPENASDDEAKRKTIPIQHR